MNRALLTPLLRRHRSLHSGEANPETASNLPASLASLLIAVLGLMLLFSGCSSSPASHSKSKQAGPTSDSIHELHLLAMPLALDLDQKPGADGFAIKVFAISRSEPKSQPIRDGTLDILMFDGSMAFSSTTTNQARHTWSFTPQQLLSYRFSSSIGVAYALTPLWTTNTPALDRISVVARFLPAQGSPIYSASSTIAVAPH